MRFSFLITVSIFLLTFSFIHIPFGHGQQFPLPDSDSQSFADNLGLMAYFDLRDRESFVQITNTSNGPVNLHVQVFNVGQNCNENDFFDVYTINDTHTYDLRNILTNDTNPSGVVLPGNAYGIVVISAVDTDLTFDPTNLIGNFRILDNSGYEYRTNMSGWNQTSLFADFFSNTISTFNFSNMDGVSLSDIVGIILTSEPGGQIGAWRADNIIRTFMVMDVDIYDINENPLSCRDIAFACVEPESSFVDEILTFNQSGPDGQFFGQNGANTASFEYGINESIPNSKGGELLCPGNNIDEGFVRMSLQGLGLPSNPGRVMLNVFVGLNNGNGRGSMDAVWWENLTGEN